ncbi:MAG: hypothetical protein AAFY72_18865 [Cyanobacteria bacterium J06649_4]
MMKVIYPLIGVALVVATVLIGFVNVGQWIVLLLGAGFTAAYINGKWGVWKELFRTRGSKFYQSLGATYVVETIIVFALYWLGRGVSGLI